MSMQAIQKRVSGGLMATKKRHAEKSEFSLHSERSPHRNQLESYIAERYEQAHNASISSFMPILLEMTKDGESQAALGLRRGLHREKNGVQQFQKGLRSNNDYPVVRKGTHHYPG
jgi:hypothetical protein